jgi:hypothetical protein
MLTTLPNELTHLVLDYLLPDATSNNQCIVTLLDAMDLAWSGHQRRHTEIQTNINWVNGWITIVCVFRAISRSLYPDWYQPITTRARRLLQFAAPPLSTFYAPLTTMDYVSHTIALLANVTQHDSDTRNASYAGVSPYVRLTDVMLPVSIRLIDTAALGPTYNEIRENVMTTAMTKPTIHLELTILPNLPPASLCQQFELTHFIQKNEILLKWLKRYQRHDHDHKVTTSTFVNTFRLLVEGYGGLIDQTIIAVGPAEYDNVGNTDNRETTNFMPPKAFHDGFFVHASHVTLRYLSGFAIGFHNARRECLQMCARPTIPFNAWLPFTVGLRHEHALLLLSTLACPFLDVDELISFSRYTIANIPDRGSLRHTT